MAAIVSFTNEKIVNVCDLNENNGGLSNIPSYKFDCPRCEF